VRALVSHPAQQPIEREALGNEQDVAPNFFQRGGTRAALEQILDVDQADDVVQVLFAQRIARVFALASDLNVVFDQCASDR
jgi:hypothetical protein